MNIQLLSKYSMSICQKRNSSISNFCEAPEGRVSAAPPSSRDGTLHVMSCYLQQIRWMEEHAAKWCCGSPGAEARGPSSIRSRSMKQVTGAIAGQRRTARDAGANRLKHWHQTLKRRRRETCCNDRYLINMKRRVLTNHRIRSAAHLLQIRFSFILWLPEKQTFISSWTLFIFNPLLPFHH